MQHCAFKLNFEQVQVQLYKDALKYTAKVAQKHFKMAFTVGIFTQTV